MNLHKSWEFWAFIALAVIFGAIVNTVTRSGIVRLLPFGVGDAVLAYAAGAPVAATPAAAAPLVAVAVNP